VSRRLCIVVHGSYPIGEPRVEREAQAARGAGWDVDVIAMGRPGEAAREVVEGVTVIRLPLRHTRGMGGARVVGEYVGFAALATTTVARRHLRRRYDVVQVCNPPDFLIVAGLLPKALGAGLVFDVHDLSSDMFEMRFGSRAVRSAAMPVLRGIERLAGLAADVVLTVHEPYRTELVRRGVPKHKTAVVMNTFDERLLPSDNVPSARAGFRIVYHGTITPHYGLDILLDAFAWVAADLPDSRLEIYGEGDAVPKLRRHAQELGVGERVLLVGQLPHREVIRAVLGASVGVIPNRPSKLNRYALSSKLFEYVRLGIPVVAASLPTLRAHFSPDELLFFEPGSASSLSAALLEVARDPDAAARRRDAAFERYTAEYRWGIHAGNYCDVLDRASSASGARSSSGASSL
jgi:glycosyltransferase involved in cell wall biosynthesis